MNDNVKLVNVIAGGFVFLVIAEVVRIIGVMLTANYYLEPAFFLLAIRSSLPLSTAVHPVDVYIMLGYTFVNGALLSFVYDVIKKSVPGKDITSKGISFGILLLMAAVFPMFLVMVTLMELPVVLLVQWTLVSFIIYLLFGVAMARLSGL